MENNVWAWNAILGEGHENTDDIDVYSAPARAIDLSGLPQTFVDTGSAEVFRDEDIAYALRLGEAGVSTELHVWRGGYHVFDWVAAGSEVGTAARQARESWIKRVSTQ